MATLFTCEDGRIINLDNVTYIADRCVAYIGTEDGTYSHQISRSDFDQIARIFAKPPANK